jgi:hypothetical protein
MMTDNHILEIALCVVMMVLIGNDYTDDRDNINNIGRTETGDIAH